VPAASVRLVQVGSALFSQIAGTFAPVPRTLGQDGYPPHQAICGVDCPGTKSLLEVEPLAALLDPLPPELLRKDATLAERSRPSMKALRASF